jgi:hypothetical protein
MATRLKNSVLRFAEPSTVLGSADAHIAARFKSTADIFYRGVMRGFSVEKLNPEAAIFLAGNRESAGVFLEGASMGSVLADHFMPWSTDRWKRLSKAAMERHPYEVHTGHGMALAVLGAKADRVLRRKHFDTLWDWFIVDGFGFQTGLLNIDRCFNEQWRPLERHLTPHGWQVFDQGLGRCLWFVSGGDVESILKSLEKFSKDRQRDLLIGLGVAATHTGGASTDSLKALKKAAGKHARYLAAGAAVAAHVRWKAGTRAEITDQTCVVLTGMSSQSAAELVEWAVNESGSNSHSEWQKLLVGTLAQDK